MKAITYYAIMENGEIIEKFPNYTQAVQYYKGHIQGAKINCGLCDWCHFDFELRKVVIYHRTHIMGKAYREQLQKRKDEKHENTL